jgi:hypothetical protein
VIEVRMDSAVNAESRFRIDWEIELFHLPQVIHLLLCLLGDLRDAVLQFEVVGGDGAQEFE